MDLKLLPFLLSMVFSMALYANNPDSLHLELSKRPDHTTERARLLFELAKTFDVTQKDSAIQYYRQALNIALEVDDQPRQLQCHIDLARTLLTNSLLMDSVELHLEAGLTLAKHLPNAAYEEASLLRTQGEFYRQKGDLDAAFETLEKSRLLLEKLLKGELSRENWRLLHDKYILVLNAEGNLLKNLSRCNEAIDIQERILELSRQSDNFDQMGYATFNMGSCYFILGDFPRALEHYLKSLDFIRSPAKLQSMVAVVSLGVGAVFAEMGQLDSARYYYKKALYAVASNQSTRTRIGTLENLGALEMQAERYDTAIYYFEQSIDLARAGDRKGMLAASLTQMGAANLYSGRPEAAFSYLSEAYSLSQELGSPSEIAYAKAALAEYHQEMGNSQRAISLAREALAFATENQITDILRRTTLTLSKAFEARGVPDKALHYFQQHVALKDSLLNEDKVREITQLKMQNQFAQEKELQRMEQEKKDAIVEAQMQRQQLQRNALGGGLLAMVLMAVLLFWGYRTKQKSNALLADKNQIIQHSLQEKEVLLKEIHHRVKNNLQVVSSLLSLQSQQVKDRAVQDAILDGRNRVKSMAMIHQDLYQTDNLTTIEVSQYIGKLTQSLFESYNIEPDRIFLDARIQPMQLDVDILIPLGLILNELITNALKYAFPKKRHGKIEVSLRQKEAQLHLAVADNGVGLPADFDPQLSDSMGYQLISAFVAKLSGKLEVRNSSGASILLMIPTPNS